MTPQEQLCEKMRVEQSAYCLWLTAQPPEEILHHAYEYSVREDIILATEEMNLAPAQVRALLKSPCLLYTSRPRRARALNLSSVCRCAYRQSTARRKRSPRWRV